MAGGGYAVEADGESAALCWGMVALDRQVSGFSERLGFEVRQVTQEGIAPGLHRVDMALDVEGVRDRD